MLNLNFYVSEKIEIKDFLAKNKFSNKLITFYLHNKNLIKLNTSSKSNFPFLSRSNISKNISPVFRITSHFEWRFHIS